MTQNDMSVAEVEVARYAAPRVHAVEVTDVITSKPLDDLPPGPTRACCWAWPAGRE
ncbi:hypothetical protein SAV14893_095350 [Streptomyces avermitilis]|uniref:Uncharacterized protein n=1 Tax=Streptomyces avermitilis TaxID=33903 RepID=A0A4D4MDV0_STRAX|nr:hypothetical protein SAV14893_095350 [Streptomyces avermitilis]